MKDVVDQLFDTPTTLELADPAQALWQLNIIELAGHKFESADRAEVNEMLASGWILLHLYTLKYQEKNVWRERPMVILGWPANHTRHKRRSLKS
jgi:hypothetical protein